MSASTLNADPPQVKKMTEKKKEKCPTCGEYAYTYVIWWNPENKRKVWMHEDDWPSHYRKV